MALPDAVLRAEICLKPASKRDPLASLVSIPSLDPPQVRHKAQKQCTSPAILFKLWTIAPLAWQEPVS